MASFRGEPSQLDQHNLRQVVDLQLLCNILMLFALSAVILVGSSQGLELGESREATVEGRGLSDPLLLSLHTLAAFSSLREALHIVLLLGLRVEEGFLLLLITVLSKELVLSLEVIAEDYSKNEVSLIFHMIVDITKLHSFCVF